MLFLIHFSKNAILFLHSSIHKLISDSVKTVYFSSFPAHTGFIASLNKDNSVYTDSAAEKMFRDRVEAYQTKKTEAYKKENADWLVENAKKPGVNTLPSGLQYKVITAGQGETPVATDRVEVVYEGKMIDGTVRARRAIRLLATRSSRDGQKLSHACLLAASGRYTFHKTSLTDSVRLVRLSHIPHSSSQLSLRV